MSPGGLSGRVVLFVVGQLAQEKPAKACTTNELSDNLPGAGNGPASPRPFAIWTYFLLKFVNHFVYER
jgi:hypothetical protein